MIKCQICDNEFDNLRKLSWHIKKHIISSKEYYLKYLCDTIPTCKICGSINVTFKDLGSGFTEACNGSCSKKLMLYHTKQTKLIKYGDEKYNNYDKAKDTCKKKYGTEFSLQLPEVRNKIKQTMNKKYGVDNYTIAPDFQNKSQTTCLIKFGKTNAHQNKNIINKTKQTCIKKYNVDNPFKSEKIIQKIKNIKLKKYGDKNYNNREKYQKTCMYRYGVTNPALIVGFGRDPYKIKKYKLKSGNYVTYQSIPELKFIQDCENKNILITNGDCIIYCHGNKTKKYYVDFKIFYDNKWQLIEIKSKHIWYYNSIKNGVLTSKIKAAKKYSRIHGYLPYKLIFYK